MKIMKKIISLLSAAATAAACMAALGVTASAADVTYTWDFTEITQNIEYNGTTTQYFTYTPGATTVTEVNDSTAAVNATVPTVGIELNSSAGKISSSGLKQGKNAAGAVLYITAPKSGTMKVTSTGLRYKTRTASAETFSDEQTEITNSADVYTITVTEGTTYQLYGSGSGKVLTKLELTYDDGTSSITPATVSVEKLTEDGKVEGDDDTTADVWYYTVTPNDQTVSGVKVVVNDKEQSLSSTNFSGAGNVCFGVVVQYAKDITESYEPTVTLTVQ